MLELDRSECLRPLATTDFGRIVVTVAGRDSPVIRPVNYVFDPLFTADRPVIFEYHGYPWLIHRLAYRRRNHANIHVRGYKEEGTTTTPFDMLMLNDMDRFRLVIDVIDRVPSLGTRASGLRQQVVDERLCHRAYTREVGDDPPEVRDWTWPEMPPGTHG